MDKRNIQSFLMVSTAFFALNAAARPSQTLSASKAAPSVSTQVVVASGRLAGSGKS